MSSKREPEQQITGKCPSCGHHGKFKHIGTQEWPHKIAQNNGLPSVTELYLCESCQTTISEASVIRDK